MAGAKISVVPSLAVATRRVRATLAGPNPYAAGGIEVDLTASLSIVRFAKLVLVAPGANLPPVEVETFRNKRASGATGYGWVTFKLLRHRYDKASVGAVSGQPGGVTVQAAKQNVAAATHTHAIDHDHPSSTSAAATAAGSGVGTGGAVALVGHTHTFDVPALVQNTPSDGSHAHGQSVLYQHNHSFTETDTAVALTELGAVNISGASWLLLAVGE